MTDDEVREQAGRITREALEPFVREHRRRATRSLVLGLVKLMGVCVVIGVGAGVVVGVAGLVSGLFGG